MKIGKYELMPGSAESREKPFRAQRSGKVFTLRYLEKWMRGRRRRRIGRAIRRIVCKNSSLSAPDIFRHGLAWYAAEPIGRLSLADQPAGFVFAMEAGQKRRIVLSALNALDALARGGLVHGNIDRHAFTMDVARDGGAIMRLGMLERCGIAGKFQPVLLGDRQFRAPEALRSKPVVTAASDVFSMGMCMHFWLSGELPRPSVESERQHYLISDRVPEKLIPVIGMMLSPDPYNRPTVSSVVWMLQGDISVDTAIEYRTYTGAPTDDEYLDEMAAALYPGNEDLVPDIMIGEAGAMGWAKPVEESPEGDDADLLPYARRRRRRMYL